MAEDDAKEVDELDAEEEDERREPARGDDISRRAGVRDQLKEIYAEVELGYTEQWERANEQMDYWDVYNCKLGPKQFYSGNAKIFVPIVHNAINARKTRFTNQIFPQSGRYVEVTSIDGTVPYSQVALLEHYVRKTKLRTKIMPALVRNGDVEGQYNVYVSWVKRTRHVTFKTKAEPELEDGIPNPAAEPVEDIEHEEFKQGFPSVELISDSDVLVLPQTVDDLEEAIAAGGSVTIIRRWTAGKIRQMIADKVIRKDDGEKLLQEMRSVSKPGEINKNKKMVDAAGIKTETGGSTYAQVYETWTLLKVQGERRLCQVFFGGEDSILGARRNPNWSDRCPLLSSPVEKVAGSFKGISKVKPCADMQYAANDAVNEAWDSAAYALMPIVMTDPEKNPRVGSMILSLAAVWETSPKDTQFAKFPDMWKDGFALVGECKAEIGQTLSVSPAAITQGPAPAAAKGSRPNQADVAREQQVDLLTTADAVTVIEEAILTPMLEMFIELDHQHRDETITIRQFGEMGVQAQMQEVEPVQFDTKYQFRWLGVESAKNAQAIQQQIAGMNVIRGIPPQQLNGYQVNLVPIITQLVENTFGPRLAPLIFVSPEKQMPVPAQQEDQLMAMGFEVPTHAMDDDQMHLQTHMQALQQLQATGEGKNQKKFQAHIFEHIQQAQRKQMAAMQAQVPMMQGAPGVPGGMEPGGGPAPGVAGSPRIGAQPGSPRTQGPPGMISQDSLQDPAVFPRKTG